METRGLEVRARDYQFDNSNRPSRCISNSCLGEHLVSRADGKSLALPNVNLVDTTVQAILLQLPIFHFVLGPVNHPNHINSVHVSPLCPCIRALNLCSRQQRARIAGNQSIAFRRFLESIRMVSFYLHNRTYTTVPVDHRRLWQRWGYQSWTWSSGSSSTDCGGQASGCFGLYFYTPTDVDPAACIAVPRMEIIVFISRNGA